MDDCGGFAPIGLLLFYVIGVNMGGQRFGSSGFFGRKVFASSGYIPISLNIRRQNADFYRTEYFRNAAHHAGIGPVKVCPFYQPKT